MRPAALKTVVSEPVAVENAKAVAKPSGWKLLTYKSRDYGVSFQYPWQYGFVSAKAIANDESLRPVADGRESQLTLVRVEVPKGFYPDTNLDNAYFSVSLNQELSAQECETVLVPAKEGDVKIDTINGTEFRWMESDNGGRGQALKLRQYVTFVGGTCYELELGVKTSNQDGLAREVDADQVMRRLDGILTSVKIQPSADVPVKTAVTTTIPQD
jgi:hypothetical protein